MIVHFFKNNNALAFIFLPLIALAFWAFGYISPEMIFDRHVMPLYELVARPLSGSVWLATTLGVILVAAEGLLLNYIISENEVLSRQTFLPALFYIVFMSSSPGMLQFHPLLFANLFLMLGINQLLASYRKDIAFSQAFDAGLLFSVATLFYFPYFVFFPLLGVVLILLRPFNWREWVISFIGVLVPYIFTAGIYFLTDKLDYLLHDKMLFDLTINRPAAELGDSYLVTIGLGWLIVLIAFLNVFTGLGTGAQRTRKGQILFIWFFIFSGFTVVLAPGLAPLYFSALAIPASVFCANYFAAMKKPLIGELLFGSFIVAAVVNFIVHFF